MLLQWSSSGLFCWRPLWAVLAWAGVSSLWCCPSSICSSIYIKKGISNHIDQKKKKKSKKKKKMTRAGRQLMCLPALISVSILFYIPPPELGRLTQSRFEIVHAGIFLHQHACIHAASLTVQAAALCLQERALWFVETEKPGVTCLQKSSCSWL